MPELTRASGLGPRDSRRAAGLESARMKRFREWCIAVIQESNEQRAMSDEEAKAS